MCTVTLITRDDGYLLGMNRDEQRARVKGLPPAEHAHGGVRVLHPAEPQGGTWIAVNQSGITLALINWYSVPRRLAAGASSRGGVIIALSRARSLDDAQRLLEALPLDRTNPFRLVAVSRVEKQVVEWRWNREDTARCDHPWRNAQWISSGFDEPGAQRSRSNVFENQFRQGGRIDSSWLRRLHASHRPGRGAYSTCMHRPDAVTVSYTEVEVTATGAFMRYAGGAPCEHRRTPLAEQHLEATDRGARPIVQEADAR